MSSEDDGGTTVINRITKVTVPSWISSRQKEIVALTAVAGTLVSFAEDPLGFVLERLLPWLVGGILDGWAIVLGALGGVWAPLEEIPMALADPVVGAGGVVLDALLGVLGLLSDVIVGVATSAGPFAPLVIAAIWIGIAAAVALIINLLPISRGAKIALAVIRS